MRATGRVLVFVSILLVPAIVRAQSVERLFYYVDREDSYKSFVAHVDQITVLGPQVYTVDSLGLVYGSLDRRVLALAKSRGVKVMPLVVNEGFNQPALRRLLADTAARSRAIASLVELCKRNGYWGIQFDIENINIQDRDRFTTWFTDAARALRAAGFTISAAIVHQTDDLPGPKRVSPLSRRQLAHVRPRRVRPRRRLSERDELRPAHATNAARPGGRDAVGAFRGRLLSPLRSGREAFARYSAVRRLLVRPDPSPDRVRTAANSVSWSWGSGLVERNGGTVKWDDVQQVPYASFEVGGTFEWVFLENARSFNAKVGLMREKKLRGFSAWVLGPEDLEIWKALASR